MKLEARFDHANVPAGAPAVVHVLLTLSAPKASTEKLRPDLNIAAVIDRSGSMNGEPLQYAKDSVCLLLDQLGPKDRFSLVVYGSDVLPLVEGARTSDKTQLKTMVQQIECSGMTNLSGGWLKGIELVNREAGTDEVKAVLLLTDGRANEGITEPDKLVSLGKDVNDKQSIRTTCMGLGDHFNEDLLRDIAVAAGGRFHYIESPEHAPEVFEEELGGLLEVVAQNVELDLTLADGVSGIAQLTGHPWKTDGDNSKLIMGDFGAEQVKHALLAVELPAITDLADMLIASLTMGFADVGASNVELKQAKQNLVIRIGDDVPADDAGDPEVLLHIGLQRAAKARQDAVSHMDEGDINGAARVLEQRRDELRSLATQASDPARLKTEADELDRRAEELRRDAEGSRKFMVAEGTAMSQSSYRYAQSARERRSRGPRNP